MERMMNARVADGGTRILEMASEGGSRTTYTSTKPRQWVGCISNAGSARDGDYYFGVDSAAGINLLESLWAKKMAELL
jgi:hypothetical protein